MLVEEISGAGVKRNAVANVVVGGDVEAGVAGIAGEAESEKIRVGANAGEIAAYCYAEAAIGGVQSERAGIDGTPGQVVSGKLRKIESVGGGEDAAVVIGVVSRQIQPAPKSGFPCEVDSSGASEVGVEKISEVRRRAWKFEVAVVVEECAELKADDVVEAAGKIFRGQTESVGEEFLLDAGGPRFAGFRFERWIAEIAEIVAEDLVEARLLDSLAVENAIQRIAPKSLAVAQNKGCSCARSNARAEIGIGFGAAAESERKARMRAVAEIQKAGLIGAARVADFNGGRGMVFEFVLIAGGNGEIGEQIACLSADVRAVVLNVAVAGEIAEFGGRNGRGIGLLAGGIRIGGEKALQEIVAVLASVGFAAADFVAPVFAGGKIPAGAGAENVSEITLVETGRFEFGLSGNDGDTGVVAATDAKLIVIAETVAEIAGERAIQKIIVRPLSVGLQIRFGGGAGEPPEQSANFRATPTGSELAP